MTKKEIVREVSATYGIDQGLAKQIVQFVVSEERVGNVSFEVARSRDRVA